MGLCPIEIYYYEKNGPGQGEPGYTIPEGSIAGGKCVADFCEKAVWSRGRFCPGEKSGAERAAALV